MTPRRLEFFSDAVFAIAATLLVLDLRLPGAGSSGRSLTYQLLHAWSDYFAYVVSFLTIGIMWVNHHMILAHVQRVTRPLLVLNLWLLMWLVLIPFPTRLVGEYLNDPSGTTATVIYGVVLIVAGTNFGVVWIYLVTHVRQLGLEAHQQELWANVPVYIIGFTASVAGILVAAFVSSVGGLTIFLLLDCYYLLDHLGNSSLTRPAVQTPVQQTPVQDVQAQRTGAGDRKVLP
jgi:uncharacterized membrane protein